MKSPTYPEALALANAAGRDAANRAARKAGRARWSLADLHLAADTCRAVLAACGFPGRGEESV